MPSKSEVTYARIVEAAITCVATIGIERTSVTEIAKAANVSRGLVAHYFPRKSEIFKVLVLSIAQRGYGYIEGRTHGLKGSEALAAYIDANLDFFFEHPDYFKTFSLLYYFAGIDPKYRALNTDLTTAARARIAGYLRQNRKAKADATAEFIHDLLVRAIQKYYVVNHGLSPKAFKAKIKITYNNHI